MNTRLGSTLVTMFLFHTLTQSLSRRGSLAMGTALLLLFQAGSDIALSAPAPPENSEPKNPRDRVLATSAEVKDLFQAFMQERNLPGLVYGVVLGRECVYSGGLGLANLEKQYPATTKSCFRIASMTKSFTAMAILQLRDAGKLRLDDPASKYVTEMRSWTYLTDDAPEITIRHLLSHGSGFPEDNPWGDRQLADSDEDLRRLLAGGVSFSTVPGTAYEYSNLGYAILGQIVQAVSGQEYQAYMREHVFAPLGMENTEWDYRQIPQERLALGYGWIDESHQPIPLEPHGAFGAMGGLITTIEDFTKYATLHLAAWPPRNGDDPGPLKRSSLREMQQPGRVNAVISPDGQEGPARVHGYAFGLGWMRDGEGKVSLGHTGGLPGFGSNWTMLPDYGLAVMSFDNLTYASTSSVNQKVLQTILERAELTPHTIEVSEILQKRKDDLLRLLPSWEGAEGSGIFAENFFLDQRLSDLKSLTAKLYTEAGTIQTTGPMKPMNQLRGSFLLHGEKKDIEVYFTLTPEKDPLIQKLEIRAPTGGDDE